MDVSGTNGWNISHGYVPEGTKTLSVNCGRGATIFHGSKQITVKPSSLIVEQNENVFLVANVLRGYYSIKVNDATYNIGIDVYNGSSGFGLSYATIPSENSDTITFVMRSSSYSWVAVY